MPSVSPVQESVLILAWQETPMAERLAAGAWIYSIKVMGDSSFIVPTGITGHKEVVGLKHFGKTPHRTDTIQLQVGLTPLLVAFSSDLGLWC